MHFIMEVIFVGCPSYWFYEKHLSVLVVIVPTGVVSENVSPGEISKMRLKFFVELCERWHTERKLRTGCETEGFSTDGKQM